jgi:hypothetical protein
MSALPLDSDINLSGDSQGVVDFDSKISDGAFDFSMAEKKLNGTKIAGPTVDQSRLRSPKRVRAVEGWVQADGSDPS